MQAWNQSYEAAVTTVDPSTVFIVKSLLYPVIVVLMLLVCLMIWNEPLYGPYFLVAVLAFFGAADFLDVAHVGGWRNWRFGLYRLLDIVLRWLLVVAFIWMLLRLSGLADRESFNTQVLLTWAIATPIALWAGQIGAQYLLFRAGTAQKGARRAVIVGVTDLGLRLEKTLREDHLLHTEVVGYFEDRQVASRLPGHASRILGRCAQLPNFVARNDIDVVYITLPMNRDPRILDLLESLRDTTVSIYFAPDLFVFNLIQPRLDIVHGIPLVAVRESPFFGVRGLAKRLFDIVVAGTAVVLALPILLAVALGVRLSSSGPIMFKQRRYGLDGKEIMVYKFRSMTVTEDGKSNFTAASRGDSRVTVFGAFIRKTSLDELPQLFNVLTGSMSIVGPRPHPIAMNEHYRQLIPSYMVRHKVKPGITGWAQVNGYRGGDDLESMTKRIEFDLDYLRRWSLWLDFHILLKTATLVWADKRAY